MTETVDNLILEHLKKIQAEQAASRERDQEIMTRLGMIESGIARITRDESSNYGDPRSPQRRQAQGTHRAH